MSFLGVKKPPFIEPPKVVDLGEGARDVLPRFRSSGLIRASRHKHSSASEFLRVGAWMEEVETTWPIGVASQDVLKGLRERLHFPEVCS